MSALPALMIGWGVFWLLIWGGLAAVFALPPRFEGDADRKFACMTFATIAMFWIIAWAVVRAVA